MPLCPYAALNLCRSALCPYAPIPLCPCAPVHPCRSATLLWRSVAGHHIKRAHVARPLSADGARAAVDRAPLGDAGEPHGRACADALPVLLHGEGAPHRRRVRAV